MAFSAEDYQMMSQRRKKNQAPGFGAQADRAQRNQNGEMAASASQARSESSRQIPKGMNGLNRSRPGVPRMPVQGIPGMPTGTSAPPPEATDDGTGGAQGAAGQIPEGTSGIPMAADAGMSPGETRKEVAEIPQGMRRSDQEYRPPIAAPGDGNLLPGSGSTRNDDGTGTKSEIWDTVRNAETGEYRNPEFLGGFGFGADRGITGTRGGGTDDEFDDEFNDEFAEERAMHEENLAREEEAAEGASNQLRRDLASQQRRQAEINALSGRSGLGGGYAGAMATTGAMGAAALEEADRVSRERITALQLDWFNKVTELNEAARRREHDVSQSETLFAQNLQVATVTSSGELPSDDSTPAGNWKNEQSDNGGGGTGGGGSEDSGTGGTGGAGEDLAPDDAPSEIDPDDAPSEIDPDDESSQFDPDDASSQEVFDEGWRPRPDGTWRDRDGNKWADTYPDTAPPSTVHMQDYPSSINSDMFENEEYGEEGQFWFNEFWEGRIGVEKLVQQMGLLLGDERNFTEDTIEELADLIIDNDSTMFSDGEGNELSGSDLSDIIDSLADAGHWNDNDINFEALPYREGTDGYHPMFGGMDEDSDGIIDELGNYADTTVGDDSDKRLLWVMMQPGLLREIVNQTLRWQQMNPQSSPSGDSYAAELMGWLSQTGLLDPGV